MSSRGHLTGAGAKYFIWMYKRLRKKERKKEEIQKKVGKKRLMNGILCIVVMICLGGREREREGDTPLFSWSLIGLYKGQLRCFWVLTSLLSKRNAPMAAANSVGTAGFFDRGRFHRKKGRRRRGVGQNRWSTSHSEVLGRGSVVWCVCVCVLGEFKGGQRGEACLAEEAKCQVSTTQVLHSWMVAWPSRFKGSIATNIPQVFSKAQRQNHPSVWFDNHTREFHPAARPMVPFLR